MASRRRTKTKEKGAHPKKRRRTTTRRQQPGSHQPKKQKTTHRKKTRKSGSRFGKAEAAEKEDEIY